MAGREDALRDYVEVNTRIMKLKRFDLGTVKDIALELVYPYHCRLERAFKHGIHHMDMGRRSGLRRRQPWLHNEGHSSS